MGSRRNVKYHADVIDSIRSDWTISDDGDDRGPIDGWPAPFLGVDDGSNQAALKTLRRAGSRSGQRFDAYPKGSTSHNLIPRQVRGNIMFHDGGLGKYLRGAPPSKLARDAFHEIRKEDALFSRTGVEGDAYRFLRRQDQGSDNLTAPRTGPMWATSTSATMAGAGDLDRSLGWGITDDAADVSSPTRTEVRSPTRTSTEAYTRGNFTATVTGGAGSGANTRVSINLPGGAGRYQDAGAPGDEAKYSPQQLKQGPNLKIKITSRLLPGESIQKNGTNEGTQIVSANAAYRLRFQTDGNLVLSNQASKTPYWAPNLRGTTRITLQPNGDLVAFAGPKVIWSTGTAGHPGAVLELRDDGMLLLRQGANVLWSTNTSDNGDLFVRAGGKRGTKSWFETAVGDVVGAAGSAVGAVGSVVKGAVSVVSGAAQIVGKLALSPARLVSDIAQGKNVFQSLKDTVKRDLASAKELAPYAQAVLSVVPGVGQGVNAAIAAGAALAQGQNITDALVAGVKGMVPGGPLAQKALETAYNVAKGQSVTEAALSTLRDQLPAGPARIAFDTGVALAQGKNIQEIAKGQGMSLIRDSVNSLSPMSMAPMSRVGPVIGKVTQTALGILPQNVKQVANALLQNPGLRSLPVDEVARRMNVPITVARDAVASVMQAAQRTGMGQAVKALAPATELAARIGTATTFDQNLARFGSRAAPHAFSPNAIRPMQALMGRPLPRLAKLMPGGAMGLQDAGAFATLRVGSTGPDVALWQKVIRVTSDGKFGPATDAATRAWQRQNGLTADGVVGPKSWEKATALGLTGSAPMLPAPTTSSPGTMTIPEVVIAAAPPPPLTNTQIAAAASMPTIREGNSGKAVETWQGILKRDSGISGYALPIDGKFGPLTTIATKKWQSSSGLVADGVVGPKSWQKGIGSLTTAPLPAESAPGVALPTPVPPNLPPGLPPVPTQPATLPAPVAVMTLPPPVFGTTPQPVVVSPVPGVAPVAITVGDAVIEKKPPAVLPGSVPQTKDEKAGNAVAALAVGALAAKLFGIF